MDLGMYSWASATLIALCVFAPWDRAAAQPADGEKREIALGLFLVDVARIDDAQQTVHVDLVLRAEWKAPELGSATESERVLSIDEVWWPELNIVNDYSLKRKNREVIEVQPDGSVLYRQRLIGEITSRHDFTEFPFDERNIRIEVVSGLHDRVYFSQIEDMFGRMDSLSISDWWVGSCSPNLEAIEILGADYPSFTLEVTATRRIGYYVWKIVFPLVMVVAMSWSVFWIDPEVVPAQVGVATTSMLTVIAYRFMIMGMIPHVSYVTRLDRFTLGSSVLVFVALVEVIVTTKLASIERRDLAHRIDRVSRWLFPIVFTIVIARFAL